MVVPTFNERDNLAALLARVAAATPLADLLVVDDSSPDGTAALCRELMAGEPRLGLMLRTRREGLGRAIVAGCRAGIGRGYALVGTMDADFSHDPAMLPAMLEAAAAADLVIGSRYVAGGRTVGWGRHRQVLSYSANRFAAALLGMPVRDATAGFKIYRAALLAQAIATPIVSNGYSFQVEIVYRLARLGARIVELPVVFREREAGRSKMSPLEIPRGMLSLLRLRFAPGAARRP